MPAGLQLWNGSGTLVLDGTTRCARIKGITPVGGSNGSAAADLSGGTPFWSFQPDRLYYHISNQTVPPIITIDANGVYWSYSSLSGLTFGVAITGTVIYGVF